MVYKWYQISFRLSLLYKWYQILFRISFLYKWYQILFTISFLYKWYQIPFTISLVYIIIIIRCQIWNRHWRPCLSKHLCHQTTSKNLNPYFVHLLPSYKDYQEMLFVVCPYRVCLLLYQLKIRIPSLYVYTHVLKIPFASF